MARQSTVIAPSILSRRFRAPRRGSRRRSRRGRRVGPLRRDGQPLRGPISRSARSSARALRKHGVKAPIDVHLMVKPVDRIVPDFAKAGATNISFHPEASEHIDRTIQLHQGVGLHRGPRVQSRDAAVVSRLRARQARSRAAHERESRLRLDRASSAPRSTSCARCASASTAAVARSASRSTAAVKPTTSANSHARAPTRLLPARRSSARRTTARSSTSCTQTRRCDRRSEKKTRAGRQRAG